MNPKTPKTTRSASTPSQATIEAVARYWDDIVDHLPYPGFAWRWSEVDIPHQCLYRFKEDGEIERAPDGDRWITTKSLWIYVISRAGDDEEVGVATGQELFDAPAKSRRVDTWRVNRKKTRVARVQTTLTGKRADLNNIDEYRVNRSKDPTSANSDDKRVGNQVTLVAVIETVVGLWQGASTSTQSQTLVRPEGDVYS